MYFVCSWFLPSHQPLECNHYCTTDVEPHFKRVANGHNQYYGQNLSATASICFFYVPDLHLHHHSCHRNTTTALLTQNHTLRGLSTENQSASWVTLSRTICRHNPLKVDNPLKVWLHLSAQCDSRHGANCPADENKSTYTNIKIVYFPRTFMKHNVVTILDTKTTELHQKQIKYCTSHLSPFKCFVLFL